jgi:tetratricopeptide (TPR) repeat protein
VPLPLDLLGADEARDLLAQRLGTDRVTAEPAAVDELIERCARLPLALAIVAARAAAQPGLPLAALAAELRHPDDRLDTLATGDAGTDLRSVFSWSYRQLATPAARLFRLVGVHSGPDLSVSAAASLAGITPAGVRPLLAELVRTQLVAERVPRRYALHDLLRAYAAELAGSGEQEADRRAAVRRLLDHYLHSAHRADATLDRNRDAIEPVAPTAGVTLDDVESPAAARDWFAVEYRVLTAAVRLAVDAGLDRHAWQLVWSMTTYLELHQDFRDIVGLNRIALQAAQRLGDQAAQAYSHRQLGRVCSVLGEHDEARAHFEQAFEVYRQCGDDTNEAHVRLGVAAMLFRQGRYEDAAHLAERALAQFETGGHRVGQANALNNLGWCHGRLGNHETSLERGEQALRLHQELGNRRGEAATWCSLGFAYHHLGRHTDAIAAYQRALTLYPDHGSRFNEAGTLVNLGDTYHGSGDTGAARDTWQAALTIFTDLDHPDAEQVRDRLRNTV